MAVLQTIADKKQGCGGSTANTGTLGCQIEFGTPLNLLGLKKGTVIPKDTNFTIDYIKGLIRSGICVPLINASSFEDLSAEDTVSTNSAGVERRNLDGLPKYRLMYEEGHEFYRELSKLTSFKSLDFIIGDESGNWKLAENNNGDYIGFSAGQVVAQLTKTKVQGGDPESKSLTVQFLNRIQWDREYSVIEASSLGWYPEDVPRINGVLPLFNSIPQAGTTIEVGVVLNSDRNTLVEGLALDNFIVIVDSVEVVATNLTEVNGIYTLTIPAFVAAAEIKVNVKDATDNGSVVDLLDVLYRSDGYSTELAIA